MDLNATNTTKIISGILCNMFNQMGELVATYPGYTDGNNTACIIPNHERNYEQSSGGFLSNAINMFYSIGMMMIISSFIQFGIKKINSLAATNSNEINDVLVQFAKFATFSTFVQNKEIEKLFNVSNDLIKQADQIYKNNSQALTSAQNGQIIINSIKQGLLDGVSLINNNIETRNLNNFIDKKITLAAKLAFIELIIDANVIKSNQDDLKSQIKNKIKQEKLDINDINSMKQGVADALIFFNVIKIKNTQEEQSSPESNIAHDNLSDGINHNRRKDD